MKRDNIRFQAQMTFDDDSIRRMFRAEYYTYETLQRTIRFVIGVAGVLAAMFLDIATAPRVLFLMVGLWMLIAGDFPSKVQAEGVIEKRGGRSSCVRYQLDGAGIQIEKNGRIPYERLDKLVYDDAYPYLFVNRQNGVMIPLEGLSPKDPERLKAQIEAASGKAFKRLSGGIMEYNIRDLFQLWDNRKKTR